MNIVIDDLDKALDAALEFAARTGICIQNALDEAKSFSYCPCAGCVEAQLADIAGEIWAENAWLRSAENTFYPCYCGQGQGGICC